jgi:hypothetical protein
MSIIYGVLEEERSHLESALALYEAKVAALPGGCLWIRSRGKRKYAYLARREKKTVRFTYVGPIPSRKHDEVALQIKERKSLEESIRNMRADLRVIERTLRYAGRSKRAA